MQYFKFPDKQDGSSEPPNKWRQFIPTLAVGLAMFVGSVLPATSFAYEAKICFTDNYNSGVSGLNVTVAGDYATHNGNGCYAISGLDDNYNTENFYTFVMETSSYNRFDSQQFQVGSNRPSNDIGTFHAIKAINGYRAEGTVVDSSGNLAGVNISVNGQQKTTGADGKFTVDFSTAGSHSLVFTKTGYPTVTRTFTVSNTQPLRSSSVRLSKGYVQVRFVDMFGQVVNDLNVTAGGKTATLNGNYYLAEGLSEGSYTLSMSNANYQSFSGNFTLSSSRTSHDFSTQYLIKKTDGYCISGTVRNASNAAFSGVTVSANGKQVISDSNGKYTICYSAAGSYELTFAKSGYLTSTRSCSIDSRPPLNSGCNQQVIDGWSVSGKVLGIDRNGLSGVTVTVDGKTAVSDANGNYTITGILTTGSKTLTLSKSGNTISRNITLSASEPKYSMYGLYLVDDYLIYGRVLDVLQQPLAGITVQSGGKTATSDANGDYTIPVATVGNHTVTLNHGSYKQVTSTANVSDTSPLGAASNMYAIISYNLCGAVTIFDKTIPFSKVTAKLGNLIATPDSAGKFCINGFSEPGNHTYTIEVDEIGYKNISLNFSAYDSQPYAALGTINYAPNLIMNMQANHTKIELGGQMIYTVTISNSGNAPANQVEMRTSSSNPLPYGVQFVSAKMIGDNLPNYNAPANGGIDDNCNITPETRILECKYLGSLGGGESTLMEVVVAFDSEPNSSSISGGSTSSGGSGGSGGSGYIYNIFTNVGRPFSLSFEASGISCLDCPPDFVPAEIPAPSAATPPAKVEYSASVACTGVTSKYEIGNTMASKITVSNSQTATTAITNTRVAITYPEGLELVYVNTAQGNCNSAGKTISCFLDTLVSGDNVSIDLEYKAMEVGIGQITSSFTSEQTPEMNCNSTTFSLVPPPIPDPTEEACIGCDNDDPTDDIVIGPSIDNAMLMFVIDITGSMGEEIDALISSITKFIQTLNGEAPNAGLITFKDDVTYRTMTNNMSTLLSHVQSLKVDGGLDCPEASLQALKEALPKLSYGARVIVVTDASSHADVNVANLIEALRSKAVKVDVILSGDDCVGVCQANNAGGENSIGAIEVFSRIAKETGGLFVTPFAVNDGTEAGAKRYENTALNLMHSTVSPTVISVTPNALPQGKTIDVTLNVANIGIALNEDSEINFATGVTVNDIEVISNTEIKANVTVAETASAGFLDITIVSQSDDITETATGLGILEILAASEEQRILAVNPNTVSVGEITTIEINGINIGANNQSNLSFGNGVTIDNIAVKTSDSITAKISVAENASLGLHKAVLQTGDNIVGESCSDYDSPIDISLTIIPKSTLPKIIGSCGQGAQGAIRRIVINAENTNFVEGETKATFGNRQDIYILETKVINATQIELLIKIDSEAKVGFADLVAYTGNEFATTQSCFEVTAKGPCTADFIINDKLGNPIAGGEINTGEHLGIINESGFATIEGMAYGEYDLTINTDTGTSNHPFIVSQNTCPSDGSPGNTGRTFGELIVNPNGPSIKIKPDSWTVYQGDRVGYTFIVENTADSIATGVVVSGIIPEQAKIISAAAIDGNCEINQELNTIVCNVADLTPNDRTIIRIEVEAEESTGRSVMTSATVTSNEYGVDAHRTWTLFRPHLSVHIEDTPDPVNPGGTLHLEITAELSQYATQKATGVKLEIQLPDGVELQSSNPVSTQYGSCDTSKFPIIKCELNDLSVSSADSVSQATVMVNMVVKDPGLLLLIHNVRISSNEYSPYSEREKTKVFVPHTYKSDICIVVDITGSMQMEMNWVKDELKKVMDGLNQTPRICFISFKDHVKLEAITNDPNVIVDRINDMQAEGGGLCPEASVEALQMAVPYVKAGGIIVLVTDASPYPYSDITEPTEKALAENIEIYTLLTGSCSDSDAENSEAE